MIIYCIVTQPRVEAKFLRTMGSHSGRLAERMRGA